MSYPSIVISQDPNLPIREYINKIVYDQILLIQPTISYADFYALMPTDNSGNIVAGADIAFPRTGSTSASDITLVTATTFKLGPIGTYKIECNVVISQPGQFVVTVNNVENAFTAAGGADLSGNHLSNSVIITTTVVDSIITIRNPVGNSTITLAASAGGSLPTSAHLVITRLK